MTLLYIPYWCQNKNQAEWSGGSTGTSSIWKKIENHRKFTSPSARVPWAEPFTLDFARLIMHMQLPMDWIDFKKILRMVLHTSFSIDRIMRVQHLRSLVAPSLLLLLPTWMHRHLQLEQGRINLLPWQGSANQKLLIWPIPLSDSKWRSFYSYRKEFESEHGRSMCYRLNLLKIRSPHGLHNSDCAIIWCQAKIN